MNEIAGITRALQDIASERDKGFNHQLKRLLTLGCDRFKLNIGIISKINNNAYKVIEVVCPDDVALKPGDQFELSNTYCSMTVASRGTVCLEHVRESSARSHPAYKNFKLEAYIGIPVMVHNKIYGTLNFSSPHPLNRKFQHSDIDTLRLMARWLGSELENQ